ncbi:CHAP domain-containing protein [Glaciihabitans arcticus]|nr:CHAP domain-containing protein [Glaciihabitans arcticus]
MLSARARSFGRSIVTILAVVAVTAGLSLTAPAQSASAASTTLCTGYAQCTALGMSNHGYSTRSGNSYWRMYGGHNCTNYAAYMMVSAGMANVRPWTNATGNASGWGVGYKKATNQTPTVGSIAWWTPNSGHVAYVEAVISPTEILISEDSWGGDFHWRHLTKANGGWPEGFIHFKDASGVGSVPEFRGKASTTTVYTDSSKANLADTTVMKPGTTAWVDMKFVNTGRTAWTGLSLATQAPNDHDSVLAQGWTAANRAAVQSEAIVSPGRTASFGFSIRIPTGLADGTPVVENFAPVLADGTRVIAAAGKLSVVADSRNLFTTKPTPTISGLPREGQVLSAAAGSWKPNGATYKYTWMRDGAAIAGATAPTFALSATDVGRKISVKVTASANRYLSTAKTSVSTAPIASTRPATIALGDRWKVNSQIVSPNGRYRVVLSSKGVLVLQDRLKGTNLWKSKSAGVGATMHMLPNGTFAAYNKKGKLVWSTKSHKNGVTQGIVTDNGSFRMMTTPGKYVWIVR